MKIDGPRERLSIDVRPEEHRKIKACAALHGETIRDYVIKSVRERLKQEAEEKELLVLSASLDRDPLLKAIWENAKDSAYDKL